MSLRGSVGFTILTITNITILYSYLLIKYSTVCVHLQNENCAPLLLYQLTRENLQVIMGQYSLPVEELLYVYNRDITQSYAL